MNGTDVGSLAARPLAGATTDDTGSLGEDLFDLYVDDDLLGTETAFFAIAIIDHLHTHLPPKVIDLVRSDLVTDPPRDVRHVLRVARRWADELGLDLPHLDLPPATTARSRKR